MSKISLGIIGGGQLGSLLCAAAKNININTNPISTLIRWAFKYIDSVEPPDRMKDSFQLAL